MALVEWEDSWEEVGTPITSPVKVILEAKATKVKIRWAPTWEPLENLRETAALAAFEWRHGPVTVCSGPNKNAAITDEVIVRLRKENEWLTGETERLKEGMERLKKGTERLKQEIQELKGENRWHKWENGELTKEILSLSRLVRQTNLHQ